jgi:hypothetical protein
MEEVRRKEKNHEGRAGFVASSTRFPLFPSNTVTSQVRSVPEYGNMTDGDRPAQDPLDEPTGCPGFRSAARKSPHWPPSDNRIGKCAGRLGMGGPGTWLRGAWDGHLDAGWQRIDRHNPRRSPSGTLCRGTLGSLHCSTTISPPALSLFEEIWQCSSAVDVARSSRQ